MTRSTIPRDIAAMVVARDLHRCARCGDSITVRGFSRQHRRPKGMGGSRREDTNLPGNLITMCGSATSPDGCHRWAETDRDEARAAGYLLYQGQDPLEVPVETWRGVLLLDHDGGFRYADRLIPDTEPERPF